MHIKKIISQISLVFCSFSFFLKSAEMPGQEKHSYVHHDHSQNLTFKEKVFIVGTVAGIGYIGYRYISKARKESETTKQLVALDKEEKKLSESLQLYQSKQTDFIRSLALLDNALNKNNSLAGDILKVASGQYIFGIYNLFAAKDLSIALEKQTNNTLALLNTCSAEKNGRQLQIIALLQQIPKQIENKPEEISRLPLTKC